MKSELQELREEVKSLRQLVESLRAMLEIRDDGSGYWRIPTRRGAERPGKKTPAGERNVPDLVPRLRVQDQRNDEAVA